MSRSLLDGTNWFKNSMLFDPPDMPVDRDTVHHIELLPNAEPHYRC